MKSRSSLHVVRRVRRIDGERAIAIYQSGKALLLLANVIIVVYLGTRPRHA